MSREVVLSDLDKLKTQIKTEFEKYFSSISSPKNSPTLFEQRISLLDVCKNDLFMAIAKAKTMFDLVRILHDDDTNIWVRKSDFANCFENCLFLIMCAIPEDIDINALISFNLDQLGRDAGRHTIPTTQLIKQVEDRELSEIKKMLEEDQRSVTPVCRALSKFLEPKAPSPACGRGLG